MNIQGLMKQMQKVQAEAAKAQAELDAAIAEGSAGGGAVTIRMTGSYQVKAVEVSADLASAGDKEMIEDSVRAALDDVLGKVRAMTQAAMSKAVGGAQIPGMPNLF